VFEFYLAFDPWLLPAGIAAGIVCAGVGGWLSLRHVLARPALQSLRDA
jgi:putative ABC transport system permease protein